jgi:hypothetical protein
MLRTNHLVRAAGKRLLCAGMILATTSAYTGEVHGKNMGQTPRSSSATLTVSAVVVPRVQTSSVATPPTHPADAVSLNFTNPHFERRFELRDLQQDELLGSESHADAVLKTLTITPNKR